MNYALARSSKPLREYIGIVCFVVLVLVLVVVVLFVFFNSEIEMIWPSRFARASERTFSARSRARIPVRHRMSYSTAFIFMFDSFTACVTCRLFRSTVHFGIVPY